MLEYDLVSRPLWRGNDWKRMTGYSSERGDFMKKGNGGIRTVVTAGILLVLVILVILILVLITVFRRMARKKRRALYRKRSNRGRSRRKQKKF